MWKPFFVKQIDIKGIARGFTSSLIHRWNSWNHFWCDVNEDVVRQTGIMHTIIETHISYWLGLLVLSLRGMQVISTLIQV